MQCTSPVWLKEKGLYVPCNHCVNCRIAYKREWAVRLMNEVETCQKACFITLTYNDDNLPLDRSLHKDVLQKFFKRLRKKCFPTKIKYYACGEYGSEFKSFRPHFHAIVFGVNCREMSLILSDVWTLGFTNIQPVFYDSCAYVTGYVMKKYNGDKAKEVYGEKEVPFRLSSQGLGKDYALKNREQIEKNLGIKVAGKNKGFPKYYQSLYIKNDLESNDDLIAGFDEGDETFVDILKSIKNQSFKESLKTRAKDASEARTEAFYDWYEKYSENVNYVSNLGAYDYWIKSVNKLRDLTTKAKCSMHEQKKGGKKL